jgi:hypothetical protein
MTIILAVSNEIQRVSNPMVRMIQIPVDEDVAVVYEAASEQDKRKFDLLLRIWLREVTEPRQSLTEIMDELGARAKARGLTPEILEEIL